MLPKNGIYSLSFHELFLLSGCVREWFLTCYPPTLSSNHLAIFAAPQIQSMSACLSLFFFLNQIPVLNDSIYVARRIRLNWQRETDLCPISICLPPGPVWIPSAPCCDHLVMCTAAPCFSSLPSLPLSFSLSSFHSTKSTYYVCRRSLLFSEVSEYWTQSLSLTLNNFRSSF